MCSTCSGVFVQETMRRRKRGGTGGEEKGKKVTTKYMYYYDLTRPVVARTTPW